MILRLRSGRGARDPGDTTARLEALPLNGTRFLGVDRVRVTRYRG